MHRTLGYIKGKKYLIPLSTSNLQNLIKNIEKFNIQRLKN